MTTEELTTITGWIAERWGGETGWEKTTPDVWKRVPAEAVWAVLVNVPSETPPPTPGEVRAATTESQTPNTTGWKDWHTHLGYPEGISVAQAARERHLQLLPIWTEKCHCYGVKDLFADGGQFAAELHTACHIPDCDLHPAPQDALTATERGA